jgi:ribonuclease HI
MAMGFLLAHSYCNGVQRLRVFGDSKLAIEFMKGNYEAKHPNIISLFECNKHLSKTFKSIVFKHVMRDFNKEANKLASDAFTRNPKENGS